jgi:hypothetical protein
MNGITELAILLKERENGSAYSPLLGRVSALPDLRVSVGDKITLSVKNIKLLVNISEQDGQGRYIYLNRECVLLPYADGQKFILLGVVL